MTVNELIKHLTDMTKDSNVGDYKVIFEDFPKIYLYPEKLNDLKKHVVLIKGKVFPTFLILDGKEETTEKPEHILTVDEMPPLPSGHGL